MVKKYNNNNNSLTVNDNEQVACLLVCVQTEKVQTHNDKL
jgi:hypothetical protein